MFVGTLRVWLIKSVQWFQVSAARLVIIWTDAMKSQAVALSMVLSKSLASLRLWPSQAKVRSTTNPRGMTSKHWAVSDRLTIRIVQRPILASARFSLLPA